MCGTELSAIRWPVANKRRALLSSASAVLFASDVVRTFLLAFEQLSPNVWETWMILTRKRFLVDIFLTRRLSKSFAFCEFASVNFEPWPARRKSEGYGRRKWTTAVEKCNTPF